MNKIKILKKSKLPFPSIDFSFRNKGNVSALISEFTILINSCKIDTSPVLVFSYNVDNLDNSSPIRYGSLGDLIIYGTNNGWGDSDFNKFNLGNKILEDFFPKKDLSFNESIKSTQTKKVLKLCKEQIDTENFETLRDLLRIKKLKELNESFPEYLIMNKHMTIENGYDEGALEEYYEDYKIEQLNMFNRKWDIGVPIYDLTINNKYVIEKPIKRHPCELFLTKKGFLLQKHYMKFKMGISDANYCSLINLDNIPDKKSYRISRIIPPNEIDKFHITIGATKSCELDIKFQFTIDGKKLVESKDFILKISNPYNSEYTANYKDGDILINELALENYNLLVEKPNNKFSNYYRKK